jgi:hypothetical protein
MEHAFGYTTSGYFKVFETENAGQLLDDNVSNKFWESR